MKRIKTQTKARTIIEILLIIFLVLPFFGLSYYTLPRSDDFSAANTARQFGGNNILSAIKVTRDMYLNWEGWYSGHFIWIILNPLGFGKSDLAIKLINLLMLLFFLGCAFFIAYSIIKVLDLSKEDSLLMTVVLVSFLLNCRYLRESIFWFTGFAYYTVQIMVGIVGLIYAVQLTFNRKNRSTKSAVMMIAVSISIIIGVGGSLQVSAIICWLYLLLLIYAFYKKDIWIRSLYFFVIALAFTLISLLSPGYSHRQSSMGVTQISPIQAIPLTLVCVFRSVKEIFTQTYSPYAFVLIFVLLMLFIREPKKDIIFNPVAIAAIGIISILISTFPVCYGYNGAYMGDRGYEMLSMQVVIYGFLFLFSIANMLNLKGIRIGANGIIPIVVASFLVLTSYTINNISFKTIPAIKCTVQLLDGSMREFSEYWLDTLHEVWYSNEEDVLIIADSKYYDMEKEQMVRRCNLHKQTDNWINKAASELYGHNTILVINSEEFNNTYGADQ